MKVILTGPRGMLAQEFRHQLDKLGWDVWCFEGDIREDLSTLPTDADFLINCAAYTKVDLCETEKDLAFSVNGDGPTHLAKWCAQTGVELVHFSTDYVFDGTKDAPYTEQDDCNPISVYGASKLAGEQGIQKHLDSYYIFRVQWLYGPHGTHFVDTIRRLAEHTDTLRIVDDQWGSPTSTTEIVNAVLPFLQKHPPFGVYHLACDGYATWCDFAKEIISELGLERTVHPQATEDYPRPATRPKNGRLDISKYLDLGFSRPNHWKIALKNYFS